MKEILYLSAERKYSSVFLVHMVRRMRQRPAPIVGPMVRQVVRTKHVHTRMINHVVAITTYLQCILLEGILFA